MSAVTSRVRPRWWLLPVALGAAWAAAPLSAAETPAAGPPQRIELDPTSIRGNQELPKVLSIVPWKDAAAAQPDGRPLNSLVDEALSPVDREVFRRQMRYFDQLYARPPDHGVEAAGSAAK
jgi:hypothetical protein